MAATERAERPSERPLGDSRSDLGRVPGTRENFPID